MEDATAGEEPSGFELFNPRTAPRTAQSLVTVKKRGALSLNEAAYGFLGQPESVQLLFNRQEKLIGIQGVSPTSPTAHRVRKQRGRTYTVSARAFLNHYEALPEVSARYVAHQKGNLLWVDLKEEGVVIEPRSPSTASTEPRKTPARSRHKGSTESG